MMNDEDLAKWARELKKYAGIVEVHRVTTFRAHRDRPDGDIETLAITVLDQGPDVPNSRYKVTVLSEATRKEASGNAHENVYGALMGVHWRNLDSPDG
jgi:hypothetical protein